MRAQPTVGYAMRNRALSRGFLMTLNSASRGALPRYCESGSVVYSAVFAWLFK